MIKFFTKRMNNRKGFTLIELIVVIAILGILAAIAIPRLSGSRYNAARKAVEANLRTIDSAVTIAEAEDKLDDTFKAAGEVTVGEGTENQRLAKLVGLGYLASEPKSTGASYAIKGDGTVGSPYRAIVTVTTDDLNVFGIKTAIDNKTVEELEWVDKD